MLWDKGVVTNEGIQLLRQVLDGKKLHLDYAVGGIYTVPLEELKEQVALISPKQQFPIIQSKDMHNGKEIGCMITNNEVTESYKMTQFGIWAHIENQAPVMMAILQDSEGLYIPSRTDIPQFFFVFYAIINFSNEASWEFTIEASLNRPRLDMVDPRPSTPGTLSQFYVNVDTGSLFVCIDTSDGIFTWLQLVEGSIASGAAILGASYLGAAYLMERR